MKKKQSSSPVHRPTHSEQPSTTATPRFPVVALGCSAGGLEALERFFSTIRLPCGMAFVVIQHLDPNHPSALPDLLRRLTPLPVVEAENGMELRPDTVAVIPPNRNLGVHAGKLRLTEPVAPRWQHLPIDLFLRELAVEFEDHAVAVILSGMGSDGVLGLQAIKEHGGLSVAQAPSTAAANSMPQSAINAGLIDIIAAPEAMAGQIDTLFRRPRPGLPQRPPAAPALNPLEEIVALLRKRNGNDFSLYKDSTLLRRIERRTALHQLPGIEDYARFLRDNPQETDLMFKELLIGVTSFFRDPEVWAALKTDILPRLLARHPEGHAFRAWITACSSGEEAYSLAMIFRETVEQLAAPVPYSLQIFATDLDPDAITRARKGRFVSNITADVSPERLARYFVPDEDGYRVSKEIRDMVIFAQQNIISDPPFTKLDLLSCRNLLIYFRSDLQKRLLPLFHYALKDEGVLLLGNAETVGNFTQLFSPLASKDRIYQRRTTPSARPAFSLISSPPGGATSPIIAAMSLPDPFENLGALTDQLIQQCYAPAAVLVNAEGDIVYISGRTGKYLEPAAGKVNINIHAMARPGLREAIYGIIPRALRQSAPITLRSLRVGTNGGTQLVNVIIQGLEQPKSLRGKALIVFQDIATPANDPAGSPDSTANGPSGASSDELKATREALRIAHEEMQSSLEELKSANEELQSTNEELQSTNEELTTSKEEMQSLNEELQTVNAELQSKVDDLTWERNDMVNLLNSTEIATVFLDNAMHVRRFTKHATSLFKLIPGDIGRPLSDVVNELDYPTLIDDAHDVLRSLVFCEKQVETHDHRWFRVRIMPYRTQDNMIDGVVATFIDITATKRLEAALRKQTAG